MFEYHSFYGIDDICWFKTDKNGISLVRPNGNKLSEASMHLDITPDFCKSTDAVDGWKRAMLFMKEFGIWDCTAFAATMDAVVCCPDRSDGAFLFLTPQNLDKISTRTISKEKRKIISANLAALYSDPNLQAKVSVILLHGMVLYFNGSSLEPIPMNEAVDRINQHYDFDVFILSHKFSIKGIKENLDSYRKANAED